MHHSIKPARKKLKILCSPDALQPVPKVSRLDFKSGVVVDRLSELPVPSPGRAHDLLMQVRNFVPTLPIGR
jgi:hypothetical protein